eukprot:CAMPEP_0182918880 /NCGR_PEP_ID=MMETSP0105_2-20130417/2351_1 /TAXON_ID=81532 ORGANISM="Acanthoeca-like sp., Strain 10tr" /NCGR_SAMPLE_ID=MMETSP0105_2 /ASSEMBLY_ACC=CAM_ASM_000205 /LENGTH=80 /DNA_ID=CAMNT_0025056003 /DNA_START=354 /DNA_END=596 /DNA_ORIENTATION=-
MARCHLPASDPNPATDAISEPDTPDVTPTLPTSDGSTMAVLWGRGILWRPEGGVDVSRIWGVSYKYGQSSIPPYCELWQQ